MNKKNILSPSPLSPDLVVLCLLVPLEFGSCEKRGGQSVVVYVDDEDSYELFERLT